MAFTLDYNTLDELGLGALPPEEKKKMLAHILETLEMRVGTTLAGQMTEVQLDEFEALMPGEADAPEAVKQKEQSALKWLEGNFPNYKDVVSGELDKLKSEISQIGPQIIADANAAQASGSNQQPAQPPQDNPQN
ncbi:MAG: DUF5663 domain-containing protein [Candidatus Saccharimonadales bacterium]